MEPEFREAFAKVFSQLSDIQDEAREAVRLSKENKHEINLIKAHVFGPGQPPPGPPHAGGIANGAVLAKGANVAKLEGRVSESESEIDALTGRMTAVESRLEDVQKETRAQTVMIKHTLKKLSGVLGDPRVVMMGRVLFAAGVAYAVSRGWITSHPIVP